MEARTQTRAIEIATALLLGIVSVVTALGVWQASAWQARADRLGLDAADARDQGVAIQVAGTIRQRTDLRSVLEARRLSQLQDAAIAAGDDLAALALGNDIAAELGDVNALAPGAFDDWRADGFPDDENPVLSAEYYVGLRGPADALTLVSTELSGYSSELKAKAAVFGQAALVHALALFLFGIAGINRLRTARIVTLGLGAAVFLVGLFLMSTAY